jgi:thiol-disulfide isomerase/thioredoxin
VDSFAGGATFDPQAMKLNAFLFALFISSTGTLIQAQQPEQGQGPGQVPQELMQRLFNPGATEQELIEAAKEANKAGVPRQQIIEAKLIWGLRTQNATWLMKILPELEVLAANFDAAQSAGIKSADDIRAFIEFTKGLQAQEKKDEAGFKKHMQEAFWLAPAQAQLFAQAIEKGRREAKMATMKIDLQLVLAMSNGETTTLADLVAGKKAVLLDFWASWCGPCMQLMPELKKKAGHLMKHGIVVAGMNKDDEKAEAVSEKVRNEQGIEFPWLIEPAERPFTKMLEIDSIPRMILIGPDGKVLYNGHPQDPALWSALQKIDPEIKSPDA